MEIESWGRRIRAFRKLKGFTQQRFAKEMGISVSVLGEVERGSREPDEKMLKKVTSVLNITKQDLIQR
ncbi:putative transcriptional regulator [Alkalihalophilus pseudofirmus OF4]|uniref:Transcriptional regulator n=1 Tax=Alkalihalophilus pseudofirmus (strain ATCC BAA-2126 / JCM 17055 / OF4) TaxID=398511 RepID=D3FR37_ALKPO|nr:MULTISPECIES: helix-turn-helix transcriptional regulator [Alkalihalophilus]ADC49733.1 putative transcriptional regulator [Alkalihalophilus pseudofirmus OF4]MED1603510.1 helix-turn-helix transcriptional regulator [Alkalihalophilus marmarensis]